MKSAKLTLKKDGRVTIEEAEGDQEKVAKLSNDYDGIVKVWKQRSTGERPRLKLWFDRKSKTFRTNAKDTPPPMITETAEQQEDF